MDEDKVEIDAETVGAEKSFLWSAVGFELVLGGIGMILLLLAGENPLNPAKYGGWQDFVVGMIATLPLIVMLLLTLRVRWGPLTRLRELVEERIVPLFQGCSLPQLALLAASAGFGEEWLFRGFLQHWLQSLAGPATALIIASLVFGACHWLSHAYFVMATGMGLVLGGLYLYTGSLIAPMVAHGLYDFIALIVLLRRSSSSGTDMPSDQERKNGDS